MTAKKSTELKLLKLYAEQNLVALKIIELLEYISAAINKSDGIKLENYSLIEKELINKLIKIKTVIAGYEQNYFVSTVELDQSRAQAVAQQNLIVFKSRKNRTALKVSLKKISSLIDQFSRKVLYSVPFSRQTAPRFVDLSI